LWFWAIQLGRGTLMTMGVLSVIYTLRMRRMQAAIVVGMLIWVAGGLTPLLVPNPLMATAQRMIHIVEILTQNALLGITAVLLLRPDLKGRSSICQKFQLREVIECRGSKPHPNLYAHG